MKKSTKIPLIFLGIGVAEIMLGYVFSDYITVEYGFAMIFSFSIIFTFIASGMSFFFFRSKYSLTGKCVICNKTIRMWNMKHFVEDWQELHIDKPLRAFRDDDIICRNCFKTIKRRLKVSMFTQISYTCMFPLFMLVWLIDLPSVGKVAYIYVLSLTGMVTLFYAYRRIEKTILVVLPVSIVAIPFLLIMTGLIQVETNLLDGIIPISIPLAMAITPFNIFFIRKWTIEWNKRIDARTV
ncbi:MAG: hypothetical protein WD154_02595 [Nitrosopumilaceae archaeon]